MKTFFKVEKVTQSLQKKGGDMPESGADLLPESETQDQPAVVIEKTKDKTEKQPEIAPEDKESKLDANAEEPEKEVPAKNTIKLDDEGSNDSAAETKQDAEQKPAEADAEKAEEAQAVKA